jgi:hypothetical protein
VFGSTFDLKVAGADDLPKDILIPGSVAYVTSVSPFG